MSKNSYIWQTKAWWEMLLKSWQAEQIFEIESIQIEKRKVSMWEYWLFVLGFEWELTNELENKLIELCKLQNCLFIQVETLNYSWAISLPTRDKWKKGVWYFRRLFWS